VARVAKVGATPYFDIAGWRSASGAGASTDTLHAPAAIPFVSRPYDLHLVSNAASNAINGGNPIFNSMQDFDGQTRPLPNGASVNTPPDLGTRPDVGADELDGTPYTLTTGLTQHSGVSGLYVYPNPNRGTFLIRATEAGQYKVQVLDMAGRLLFSDTYEGTLHQMRVSLPAGVYQVRLVEGDKTHAGRLIITE